MKMKICLCILLVLSLEAALRLPVDAQAAARPWKCCDRTLCTRSQPPTCRCLDAVDQCAATCKDCAAATSDPSRHVCNDQYFGDPGPKCTAIAAGGN